MYLVAFDPVKKKTRRISIHDDLQRTGIRMDALLAGIWKARKAVRVGSFVTVRGLKMKVVKVSPNGGLVCRFGLDEVCVDCWEPYWLDFLSADVFVPPSDETVEKGKVDECAGIGPVHSVEPASGARVAA